MESLPSNKTKDFFILEILCASLLAFRNVNAIIFAPVMFNFDLAVRTSYILATKYLFGSAVDGSAG